MSKINLIENLKKVVNVLRNDTINYQWDRYYACNCGVVVQALLEKDEYQIKNLADEMFEELKGCQSEYNPTWKNAIKHFCPITGKSRFEILNELLSAGLTRDDMTHLEYLDNPAILAMSGIEKVSVTRVIHKKTFMNWLRGIKYKEVTTIEYPRSYYTKKENLIKYLNAWIKILQGESTLTTEKEDLHCQLLNAVADENYEKAAELRDKISVN